VLAQVLPVPRSRSVCRQGLQPGGNKVGIRRSPTFQGRYGRYSRSHRSEIPKSFFGFGVEHEKLHFQFSKHLEAIFFEGPNYKTRTHQIRYCSNKHTQNFPTHFFFHTQNFPILQAHRFFTHKISLVHKISFFYRPTVRPRHTSLPLECHRNATNRTRSVSSARHSTTA
jgi:hypothetical protein